MPSGSRSSPGSTCCSPGGGCRSSPRTTLEGEIEQGTGELGFFSPHSWWPLFVGRRPRPAALGAAIGWWLFLIGMLAVVFTTIGFVFEYYHGEYAH